MPGMSPHVERVTVDFGKLAHPVKLSEQTSTDCPSTHCHSTPLSMKMRTGDSGHVKLAIHLYSGIILASKISGTGS